MKLIINADDFGYTKGVSEGIIEGYHKGCITSTTVLCNMPKLEEVAYLRTQAEGMGFGVHLTLTLGDALTKGKTLTTNGRHFKNRKQFYQDIDTLDTAEVYEEFKAQIERFIAVFKTRPDHLDSHHSVHDAGHILQVSQQLAKEYQLPMRRYSNFTYVPGFYGEEATVDTLLSLLAQHEHEEGIEIMTHPGFCDLELYQSSSYHTQRVVELAVLCDERLRSYMQEHAIILTNYTSG